MNYSQLIIFLKLSIANFQPELLVLIGNTGSFEMLFHLQSRLDTVLPAIVISSSEIWMDAKSFCKDCPTNRLTIVSCSTSEIGQVKGMAKSLAEDTNRLIFVKLSETPNEEIGEFIRVFMVSNIVLVEVNEMGNLEVLAWSTSVTVNPEKATTVSRFKGPEAIFLCHNDSNAMMFRGLLDHWPRSQSARCAFLSMMSAPHHFVASDESTGQKMLVSATSSLLQLIGDTINYSLTIFYPFSENCSKCFDALPLPENHRSVRLTLMEVLRKHCD